MYSFNSNEIVIVLLYTTSVLSIFNIQIKINFPIQDRKFDIALVWPQFNNI